MISGLKGFGVKDLSDYLMEQVSFPNSITFIVSLCYCLFVSVVYSFFIPLVEWFSLVIVVVCS